MKYGKKDYEELLDKAVQFMKNHGLYDSYWSRDEHFPAIPMSSIVALSDKEARDEFVQYLTGIIPSGDSAFCREAEILLSVIREYDAEDKPGKRSLAQQLAWELTELGEEIDHYGLMDAMESGESKEDMVRKSYQGLLEPGGCEASLNWLEEFLDECEEDGPEVQKVKDTCRKIRKMAQELKEKSGKHDPAVEGQTRGRQR